MMNHMTLKVFKSDVLFYSVCFSLLELQIATVTALIDTVTSWRFSGIYFIFSCFEMYTERNK